MKNIAVAIPVRNEGRTIRQLLDALVTEFSQADFGGKVFIYTDAPNDNTLACVQKFAEIYPNIFVHIHGGVNKGKIVALNTLLKLIKQQTFDYVVTMDGDVQFDKGTLKTLVDYMEKHKDLLGATPVMLPSMTGNRTQQIRSRVIQKKTRFIVKYGGYRYLTGRMNITRGTQTYKTIDSGNIYDDIHLNLVIPYEKIGICADCTVLYDYKSTRLKQLKYKHREGRAFRALKQNCPELYKEQKRRVSFTNIYLKGGLGENLGKFLAGLTLSEEFNFILELITNSMGFLSGYLYETCRTKKTDPLIRGSWDKLR